MIAAEITTEFATALGRKFATYTITTMGGRKYDRIVTASPYGGKSVHAFVERETGFLYKAAGWAGPAKDARYNLSDEGGFLTAIQSADPYGSYLYKR